MLTIKIDQDQTCFTDIADYLREVARLAEEGYRSGYGWDITGEEERQEDSE